MKDTLSRILKLHASGTETAGSCADDTAGAEVSTAQHNKVASAWDRVELSRMKDRPVGEDYIQAMFTDFIEFHGDRCFADDKAVIGGVGRFNGRPVTVIAQAKGTNTKENIERNFGMPSPDGYRKALQLMKQAEKFGRPVICFVDTPGRSAVWKRRSGGRARRSPEAYMKCPPLEFPYYRSSSEKAEAEDAAMATSDEVWMLENSVYSILSPEGFASILWKDSTRAKEAAEVMKLTAGDLLQARIVEQIVKEPGHYTVQNMKEVTSKLKKYMERFLGTYGQMSEEELTEHRYMRFRRM
ncbi:Acetyl-coenzyme A carboxylase carboxyl transferase subunit alpha [[Clostridium] hylemonae DSM 15053]|uniref:carboxyl transferase domain-containing protein n=1 Tax=[Clostridium] hylemonae TaxID=89153 RepID=UPI001257532F|nr:carboxyl transferase domain-containing protein [[Clostridium] hylemonae]QEK18883.1 Acetyl-coenzyme A carboxylase carboxyl transferase subunit alpha [[Clostridium] hylemonae DSM 15053]